jgi:hypothetical protein
VPREGRSEVLSAYTGADGRYTCATEGDADTIETGHVDPLVADVVGDVPATTDGIVTLNGSLAGLQVFPTDNWWNRDVSLATVPMNSDDVIDYIGRTKPLHADFGTTFGIPYIEVEGTQPKLPLTFLYDDESDYGAPGLPLGYPIPEVAQYTAGYVEAAFRAAARRAIVTSCSSTAIIISSSRSTRPASAVTPWTGGSGAIFNLATNDRRPEGWTSADAAASPSSRPRAAPTRSSTRASSTTRSASPCAAARATSIPRRTTRRRAPAATRARRSACACG